MEVAIGDLFEFLELNFADDLELVPDTLHDLLLKFLPHISPTVASIATLTLTVALTIASASAILTLASVRFTFTVAIMMLTSVHILVILFFGPMYRRYLLYLNFPEYHFNNGSLPLSQIDFPHPRLIQFPLVSRLYLILMLLVLESVRRAEIYEVQECVLFGHPSK